MATLETGLRTHTCGSLTEKDVGKRVSISGWVANHRDHGGVLFVDLRDRWGKTQVVFRPEHPDDVYRQAGSLKLEWVVRVEGRVAKRPNDMVNPDMPTGEIEIDPESVFILNEAKTLPFLIKDEIDVSEELRFKYRFLDIRRPAMQANLLLRHRVYQSVRRFFDAEGFIEIETPFLMKSTPEGARDFLVPSRIHKGKFYALPQSPQTYKQLLMVSGFDRYCQIVRCFRDEDFRADRQPEFTQIDIEMSFVDEEDVIGMMERMMVNLFKEVKGVDLPSPFKRLSYEEATARYGTDRPDLRFGLEIEDVSQVAAVSGFKIFAETVGEGGAVRGIRVPDIGSLSRKQVDEFTSFVREFGASGLVTIQIGEEEIRSPISKFLKPESLTEMKVIFEAGPGDVIFLVAAPQGICSESLGQLRNRCADLYGLRGEIDAPLWITDFPLLEWSETENRYMACHHPFTSPKESEIELLESTPQHVHARAYDLVLNGSEIAGGSIRIHRRDVQERVFKSLAIDQETAERKFGFLMEALECGAPPHGGIAFGFDRLVMIMAGESSIREVIAFPKTTSALSLMDGSPSEVDDAQLKELGIMRIQSTE